MYLIFYIFPSVQSLLHRYPPLSMHPDRSSQIRMSVGDQPGVKKPDGRKDTAARAVSIPLVEPKVMPCFTYM